MKENYINIGDLVKVVKFDGLTGKFDGLTGLIRSKLGQQTIYKVVGIERPNVSVEEYLAFIQPCNGSREAAIAAQWCRLRKEPPKVMLLPDPDMELEEIHAAQALMER